MKACDICGANCGPEDMGEYDEKTGIYACSACVEAEQEPTV